MLQNARCISAFNNPRSQLIVDTIKKSMPLIFFISLTLDQLDFLFAESVEFIDQGVDLAVGGVDGALEGGAVAGGAGVAELFVQVDHVPDKLDHPVVSP